MKKPLAIITIGLIASTIFTLGSPLAAAHDQPRVSWSIGIGAPYPAYSPPPVIYVRPQPVYVETVPVIEYRGPYYPYGSPYYVEEVRKFKHHHWKHHRHHDYDD